MKNNWITEGLEASGKTSIRIYWTGLISLFCTAENFPGYPELQIRETGYHQKYLQLVSAYNNFARWKEYLSHVHHGYQSTAWC